jgi:Poly(ADP-ribose) polymerase catalytic domain.
MTGQEFIYVMKGNWFELRKYDPDKTFPCDRETLQNEILEQVNSRSEKLDFIDISFGQSYRNKIVEDIIFDLDQNKFQSIAEKMIGETKHPIITFHGTSYEAIQSILAGSYLLPGKDSVIKIAHGWAYGPGVYSSPHLDKAMYYTKVHNSYVYVLINLVFVGKVKLVGSNQAGYQIKNNCYADGCHTRIVYGLEQVVSPDPARVVPVGFLKIKVTK